MKEALLLLSLLVAGANAFRPSFRPRGVSSLSMVLIEPDLWAGQSAPVRAMPK